MNYSYDVIMVNYNGGKIILEAIKSINQANLKPNNIIIYDNCSLDNSVKEIHNRFPKCKIIKGVKNIGFGKANNCAIAKSKSDFLLFANPDLLIDKKCPERLIGSLVDNPNGVIASPLIYQGWNKSKKLINSFGSVVTQTGFTYNINNKKDFSKANCFNGAAFMARRDFIKKNLFEKKFFLYYEEPEMTIRILKQGNEIIRNKTALCYHLEHYATNNKKFIDGLCFRQYYGIQNRWYTIGLHWPIRLLPKTLILNFGHLLYFELKFIINLKPRYCALLFLAPIRFIEGFFRRKKLEKVSNRGWYLNLPKISPNEIIELKNRVLSD